MRRCRRSLRVPVGEELQFTHGAPPPARPAAPATATFARRGSGARGGGDRRRRSASRCDSPPTEPCARSTTSAPPWPASRPRVRSRGLPSRGRSSSRRQLQSQPERHRPLAHLPRRSCGFIRARVHAEQRLRSARPGSAARVEDRRAAAGRTPRRPISRSVLGPLAAERDRVVAQAQRDLAAELLHQCCASRRRRPGGPGRFSCRAARPRPTRRRRARRSAGGAARAPRRS